MQAAITGIGIANPEFVRKQQDAADLITAGFYLKPAEKRLINSVYKATGIEKRYSVLNDFCRLPGEFEFFPNEPDAPFPSTGARMKLYKDNALKLALRAIKNCLDSNNLDPIQITHVITISCTGMYAPGLDIEIIQTLNLKPDVQRTAINFMGCYGAFNGMKVAEAFCKADPNAVVLLVSVELCTIHFQKSLDISNVLSNSIFADGAAAVIVQARPSHQKCFILKNFFCDLIPQSNHEMAWSIADSGFDIVLSSYVPEIIQSGISQFAKKILALSKLSHFDLYAIHPGGRKILEACEKSLQITKEDNKYSYHVLQNYGNMSSATILFVLKKIWDDETIEAGSKVFSCAFGPGLTMESSVLETQ